LIPGSGFFIYEKLFGKPFGFFLFVGPSAGYLLNGTDKALDGQTNVEPEMRACTI